MRGGARRQQNYASRFTFSSFVRMLSRATPHESKLYLLRNIELFRVRPDMLTTAIARVPWANALALLDGAFYVLPQVEPAAYVNALSSFATSAASPASAEHQQQRPRQQQQPWTNALRVLARLVESEGDRAPPRAFVHAAHCLVPGRRWAQALQLVAKPADRRNVASRALMLAVSQACCTRDADAAWIAGLRAFALADPQWQDPAERRRAARIGAQLCACLPWRLALRYLLPASSAATAAASPGGAALHWRCADAILESPELSTLLFDGMLSNPSVPLHAVEHLARHSAAFAAATAISAASSSVSVDSAAPVMQLGASSAQVQQKPPLESGAADDDAGGRQRLPALLTARLLQQRDLSPSAARLAMAAALRARDVGALAELASRAGVLSAVGRANSAAAVVVLRQEGAAAAAIRAAQRCLAEGVRPLDAPAVWALVQAFYVEFASKLKSHQQQQQQQSGRPSSQWHEALGLVSALGGDGGAAFRASAAEPPRASIRNRSRGGEGERAASAAAGALTQLILLMGCCPVHAAPAEALALLGTVKKRFRLSLRHEKQLVALLFCRQHGRWQESIAILNHHLATSGDAPPAVAVFAPLVLATVAAASDAPEGQLGLLHDELRRQLKRGEQKHQQHVLFLN